MDKVTELNNQIKQMTVSINEQTNKLEIMKSQRELLETELLEERTGFKCGQIVLFDGKKGILERSHYFSSCWSFRWFKKDGILSKRTQHIFNSEKIYAINDEGGSDGN